MEFLGIDNNDILVMRGAALGIALDHNEETYYVLCLVGGDSDGNEQVTTFAIPPMVTEDFLRIIKAMEAKREEPI